MGIGGKIEIGHRVGDPVAHFVGVTLRHGFAGEDVICPGHLTHPCFERRRTARRPHSFSQTTARAAGKARRQTAATLNSIGTYEALLLPLSARTRSTTLLRTLAS